MSLFPASLKRAEITAIHKKNDTMLKENYRPVSVLPALSKVVEGVFVDQLSEHFQQQQHLSPCVSGFRKGSDCQGVLIHFSESVKHHLDNGEVADALLIDLSKVFDCFPHDLLVCKMYAYGLSEASFKLIASYLKDR